MDNQIQQLQNQVTQLSNKLDDFISRQNIDTRVNFFDILGKFEVVSTAPVGKPNDVSGQVKIYVNGVTYRLYWYDTTAGVWHYVTATA